MAYLLGIAVGARCGGRFCRRNVSDVRLWTASVAALLLSAVLTILLPALFAVTTSVGVDEPLSAVLIIATQAFALAFVFPIAHHLGADRTENQQGRRFAKVYTANVAGAALGPLFTGYFLLDWITLQQCFLLLSLFQLSAAIFFAALLSNFPARSGVISAALTGALSIGLLASSMDSHELIQRLIDGGKRAKTIIENRQGVITIFPTAEGDDAVYGGNLYDGRTNLDPETNTNGLERTLLLATLQPQPKRVLILGLSIGTWLALVNEFPGVERVDVVEINPGYLQAAQAYPMQARALRDARVHVHVDDARRWLRRMEGHEYDLIVMNTTWHWRANVSLLLSKEFLALVKRRMAPGAITAFNSTGSPDAFFTASTVFRYAYRYQNFLYVADFDFSSRKNSLDAAQTLATLKLDGRPMFAPASERPAGFLAIPFETVDQIQRRTGRPLEQVTDQNMITEFKYGRHLY